MPMSVRTALVSMPTPAEIWLEDTSVSASLVGLARTVTPVSKTWQWHNDLYNKQKEKEVVDAQVVLEHSASSDFIYLY